MIKSCSCHQVRDQKQIMTKIDEYIGEMHTLLLRPTKGAIRDCIFSREQILLLSKFPTDSKENRMIKKCIQLRDFFFDFIIEEKQIVNEGMAAVKQIQYQTNLLKDERQSRINGDSLSLNLQILKKSLNRLPFGNLQIYFQQKVKLASDKNKLGLDNDSQILRRENVQLKQKISEYEKKIESIEFGLNELFQLSKQEQKRHYHNKKLIDRICENVFSEQYMIQANFQIRNEYKILKEENLKLRLQLERNKQVISRITTRQEPSTACLRNIVQNRPSQTTLDSKNLVQVVEDLEQQIEDLKLERRRDEKIISNLQVKMEKIEEVKAARSKQKLQKFKKVYKKQNNTKAVKPSVFDLQNGHINLINQKFGQESRTFVISPFKRTDQKINTDVPTLSYSRSSKGPKQNVLTANIVELPEGNRRIYSQTRLDNPKTLENDQQQLKTSGYFIQPESSYSYFSNSNSSERNEKLIRRRGITVMQYKTP